MNKLTMAESVLNRMLNFADELDAPPIGQPALQGSEIDQALLQPTGPMPADPAIADAVVMDRLGLGTF